MKKKLLFVLLLLVPFLVNAESNYYDHIWTYDVENSEEYIGFVTNDIIDYNDGFLAVGFKNDNIAAFVLDANGEFVKSVNLNNNNHGKAKRVFETSNGYVIIAVERDDIVAIALNSNLKYQGEERYDTGDYYYEYESDLYAIKADEKIYMWNTVEFEDNIVVLDTEDGSFSTIGLSSIPTNPRKTLTGYMKIQEYDTCFIEPEPEPEPTDNLLNGSGKIMPSYLGKVQTSYCISFERPYKDGYLFGLNGNEKGLLVRYEDEEIFTKTFNNLFLKDAIHYRNNIFVAAYDYDNDESQLIVVSEEGKTLETTPISEYVDDEYFIPEHLIPTANGFALTGSTYGCKTQTQPKLYESTAGAKLMVNENEPPKKPEGEDKEPPKKSDGEVLDDVNGCYEDMILYFMIDYNVETKTDGNGEIKVNQIKAKDGDLVEFEVIPKEGYVLGEVKVTDADGNIIVFTDYKFTMPSADVLIEARFVPINPNTKDAVKIAILLAIVSAIAVLYTKNKRKELS